MEGGVAVVGGAFLRHPRSLHCDCPTVACRVLDGPLCAAGAPTLLGVRPQARGRQLLLPTPATGPFPALGPTQPSSPSMRSHGYKYTNQRIREKGKSQGKMQNVKMELRQSP